MIHVSHTKDMELVRIIMTLPEMWEESTEDDMNIDNFFPGYDTLSAWLLCKIDDVIIGVILVHNDNNTTIKIHPYLLKEYRKYGRDVIKNLFKLILKMPDVIQKVNVTIPFTRKILYNFAKKIGFKDEGINRLSFLKEGELHNQWMLGLTRNEIEDLL